MYTPLLTYSGSQLARLIRSREVSSREVVEAHIERIREVNPTINAVVCDRFELARQEARRADERLATGERDELPPFHGVPCTVKEAFALAGMPNTSGLVSRTGFAVSEDATAVQRLRDAGAIVLGVTNISELCMWMESNNYVYGRSNNPYDPRHIVGGSSGGEGAIIAAGGSPFGLGSDIGGSIRLPAFFNGIFGHKPTGGLVPGTGQFPNAENEAVRYVTTGPLARRAEDLMPLLRIMAGPDGEDPGCEPFELGDPEDVRLDKLTVYDIPDNGAIEVSQELRMAQRRCVNALQRAGARVERIRVELLQKSFEIWSSMLSAAGGTTFSEHMGAGQPINGPLELGKWLLGRSPHTLPAIGLALLEKLTRVPLWHMDAHIEQGRRLKQQLSELLGPHSVILYPSYVSPAPVHNKPLLLPFSWVYTAIFNVMELPSTQVPLGLNHHRLPLGVQVVGAHAHDHVTIAVALELEKSFGGWVFPPDAR